MRPVVEQVLEWDVEDGGVMGAVVVCQGCGGSGNQMEEHDHGMRERLGCQECQGSGELHRPYMLNQRVEEVPSNG